jgi:hypothetical protein
LHTIQAPRATSAADQDMPRDAKHPASVDLVKFSSGGQELRGRLFVASGAGPHPTLLLLHGFPGTELNFDLAHAARRAGWNVLIPHYRGSWGMPGTFTWHNVLADTEAALAWLRSPQARDEFRVDAEVIAVAGHSLGGFAALRVGAKDPKVRGVASLAGFNFGAYTASLASAADRVERTARSWSGPASVLAGATGKMLAEESFAAGESWDLRHLVPALAARPILLIAATYDDVSDPPIHHAPLVQAFQAVEAKVLTTHLYETDHSFVDTRMALAGALVSWLGTLGGQGA